MKRNEVRRYVARWFFQYHWLSLIIIAILVKRVGILWTKEVTVSAIKGDYRSRLNLSKGVGADILPFPFNREI